MGVTFIFKHLRDIFGELAALSKLLPPLSMSFKSNEMSQSTKYTEKGYRENVYSLYIGLYDKEIWHLRIF